MQIKCILLVIQSLVAIYHTAPIENTSNYDGENEFAIHNGTVFLKCLLYSLIQISLKTMNSKYENIIATTKLSKRLHVFIKRIRSTNEHFMLYRENFFFHYVEGNFSGANIFIMGRMF